LIEIEAFDWNDIDYEKFTEILLAIDVIDQDDSDLIETIICKIEINDLNDNSPIFDLVWWFWS
jgi:hypothetical protein